jgi:EAL domain-containing protein (putative c-di-GMP-specific phosphodiesterase class I)
MINGTCETPATDRKNRGETAQFAGSSPEQPLFQLELELAAALHHNAIQVNYQPQYEVATGRGCGVEALARWQLSSGNHVSPSAFIPVAEQSGLIHDLGSFVLQEACRTAHTWFRRGTEPATVAVNVSALQINDSFGRLLDDTLKKLHFPAVQLELEITESALIVDPDRTIAILNEWRQMGVRIAIDDFGTGYSSLSYLTRLPVDRLKIDRALVQRMTLDRKSVSIMRLLLAVATELGLDVIAEGVETEPQLGILIDLGCPKVQGYLFCRPLAARLMRGTLLQTWGNRAHASDGVLNSDSGFAAEAESHAA